MTTLSTDPTASIEDVIRKAVTQPVQFQDGDDVQGGCYHPPIDLKDTPREYVAYIDLPGVDEDALQFSWHDDVLCIGGCRDFDHDSEDAEEYIQMQRRFGDFMCRIPLNDKVDVSNATAKYKRGVLKVHMPKKRISGRTTN